MINLLAHDSQYHNFDSIVYRKDSGATKGYVSIYIRLDYAVWAVALSLQKNSEACGADAKACNATREGPAWIAISCTAARATAPVHAEPRSSDNVDHGL